jgi:general secretion pathway protein M
MRERWENLSLQEKQVITGGGFVVIVCVIYFFLWSPLADKTANLRDQIQHDQTLLSWMEKADQQIQSMGKKSSQIKSNKAPISLLSQVQQNVKQQGFADNLTQLHQVENNAVQLSFKQINFDDFMQWLTDIWRNNGIIVSQISIVPVGVAGIVTIDLVLKGEE